MPIRTGLIVEDKVEIDGQLFETLVTTDRFKVEEDFIDTGYYVVIRKGVHLGKGVRIWSHCTIDPDAIIKDGAKLHNHVYVCQQAIVEENAFLAPHCILLNDRYPERTDPKYWEPPIIKKGAKIGGGAMIGPGVTVGENAIIGIGAVVIRDVPPGQVWAGNPAKRIK